MPLPGTQSCKKQKNRTNFQLILLSEIVTRKRYFCFSSLFLVHPDPYLQQVSTLRTVAVSQPRNRRDKINSYTTRQSIHVLDPFNFHLTIHLRSTATANRNFNRLLMCLAVLDSLLLVNLVAETAVMNTFMGRKDARRDSVLEGITANRWNL